VTACEKGDVSKRAGLLPIREAYDYHLKRKLLQCNMTIRSQKATLFLINKR